MESGLEMDDGSVEYRWDGDDVVRAVGADAKFRAVGFGIWKEDTSWKLEGR